MKRVALMCAGIGLLCTTISTPIYAAPCGLQDRSFNDWGKTESGFEASMEAGCHAIKWTGPTTDSPGRGSLTFRTVGNVDPWSSSYSLPGPQGGNYCQYRAAHEANGFATNLLQLPVGTEVTVKYWCD